MCVFFSYFLAVILWRTKIINITRFRETVTPLLRSFMSLMSGKEMRFKSRLKRSDSTAGSRNESSSKFKIVGSATEKVQVPDVLLLSVEGRHVQHKYATRRLKKHFGDQESSKEEDKKEHRKKCTTRSQHNKPKPLNWICRLFRHSARKRGGLMLQLQMSPHWAAVGRPTIRQEPKAAPANFIVTPSVWSILLLSK